MLILRKADVESLLDGREQDVLDVVGRAYRLHDEGRSALPHSSFLRFPDQPRDRIIALPAFLGGDTKLAGLKWIASFPGNLERGIPRASAALLLNSCDTGVPEALLEASLISARRTAAGAALGALALGVEAAPRGVSLLGCGVINFETLRFLRTAAPSLAEVALFDLDAERAKTFAERAEATFAGLTVTVVDSAAEALAAHRLVALATTAATPYLDLADCRPGTTVLHTSLRDIEPEALLGAQNVVDDVDHVARERTSVHLAEQLAGHRDFIDATIGAVLRDPAALTRDPERVLVYSPFGLGVLDIALADHVRTLALAAGRGVRVDDFLTEAQA
ncbi:2,3-diaminopropionate biosynthesis protein SbnB [Actinoplanes sp. TRM 88003]|uniref:2,3-diaminopropionate biosynthesis protein SbnB n=1 Tax=Paractinoplanes aksuensis TaxID=2939490 RepID=A0ABT1DSW4_9ACTN|nr:2,3-diaminopropionate biosynthesis protein SbnB [Actinoplanes aksuensis]MCO8273914.1 2,3-diaminopropionate biosynthesis protein SbnB [Actinoplanes aksuensis]